MSYPFDCGDPAVRRRGLEAAASAVQNEQLVVLPVESAYGLACDAFSVDAVADLLEFKGDPARRPPAVLVPNVRTIDGLVADVPDAARALAEAFWPGLLTLVCTQQPTLRWDLGENRGTVSLRMPVHPLALELLTQTGPLALTTAAPIGTPAPKDCITALELVGDFADVYLDAGPAPWTAGSTVVDVRGDVPRVVRQGAVGVEELRSVVPDLLVPEVSGS
ncbi:MAG TPA: L-threonylcarbamoyladenylate synthase [Kineosporiaceae bacterium]|nr:L-threonylcarbamoyladenylate synthase [Kineosporiaceae bacterium]